MAESRYTSRMRNDLYTLMYEQYYFNNSKLHSVKQVNFTKRTKTKKKQKTFAISITNFIILLCLLFFVFPYSYSKTVKDILPVSSKNTLKADYRALLYPTHSYLYKNNLFLGKYILKDTEYKVGEMNNIYESREMTVLKNSLMYMAEKYSKIQPSVYVWEYGTKNFVNINADEIYPAASIIKIPVLIEMFRQIDAGKFGLNDYMTLEDWYRAPGSGKLQYAQGGINYSIDYLAGIMIENSDNSATNMIMAKFGGMPAINRAIKKWGLKKTEINNWLPDLAGTNVTTSREMAKMLYNLDTSNLISKESKHRAFYYLSHVKNNRLLKAGLPDDAYLFHKTGDIGHMLGDAGIVVTPSRKKYIVVILAKRPYNNLQGKDFIVNASKLIYDYIMFN